MCCCLGCGRCCVRSVCVCGPHMCSPSGSVSCHVGALFSRRAARVGADVKDGKRGVWCSRMWCWLFGCVHRLYCVCGAICASAVPSGGTRLMSRRRDVLEESGACRRKLWSRPIFLFGPGRARLALVQHRHLPARGLLSLFSLLRAFLLTVIKRNQTQKSKIASLKRCVFECRCVLRI